MYTVTKRRGYSSTITLTNDETGASAILGVTNMPILKILNDYLTEIAHEEPTLDARDEWLISVDDETANALKHTMYKGTKKPERHQSKKSEQPQSTQEKKQVDAMDVLLGLANY